MKVDYKTIEKIVLEGYTGSDLEIAAFTSQTSVVAEMLKAKGYDPQTAGTFVSLIQAGKSEEEALKTLK